MFHDLKKINGFSLELLTFNVLLMLEIKSDNPYFPAIILGLPTAVQSFCCSGFIDECAINTRSNTDTYVNGPYDSDADSTAVSRKR